jgi:hypothetical protein
MSIADRFTGPGDDPAMSKLALELRRSVIAESNLVAVADRTTALNLDLLESIRALGLDRASQLLVAALVARSLIDTAGAWLADATGQPRPDCFAAIDSIVRDVPPQLSSVDTIDGKEES